MLNPVDKGKGEWRVVIRNRVVWVFLIEKRIFELRPEGEGRMMTAETVQRQECAWQVLGRAKQLVKLERYE